MALVTAPLRTRYTTAAPETGSPTPQAAPYAVQPVQPPQSGETLQRQALSQTTQTQPAPGSSIQPYPTTPSTFFQPRTAPPSTAKVTPAISAAVARQQALAGPLAAVLPISQNRPLTRGDIPLLEAGLNFEQIQQAEADRQRGFEELVRARSAIGGDPYAAQARDLALSQAQQGPLTQDLQDRNVAAIRNQSALGLQNARERALEDFARRGLSGGSLSSFELGQLEQTGAVQAQQQITDFLTRAAEANRNAQSVALGQLQGQTGQEELRRLSIDQLLSDIFLSTERAPISLAGLIPRLSRQDRPTKPGTFV